MLHPEVPRTRALGRSAHAYSQCAHHSKDQTSLTSLDLSNAFPQLCYLCAPHHRDVPGLTHTPGTWQPECLKISNMILYSPCPLMAPTDKESPKCCLEGLPGRPVIFASVLVTQNHKSISDTCDPLILLCFPCCPLAAITLLSPFNLH